MTGGGEKGLELYPPIEQGKIQFRNIDDVLYHQFERRSEIEREPVTGVRLCSNLVLHTRASGEIINALQSPSRRCIISGSELGRFRQ